MSLEVCSHVLLIVILLLFSFIAERTEEASRAMATKRELQSRVEHIAKDFEEEQNLTFEMRQDMTRQYKGMQEELLSRVRATLSRIVLFTLHSQNTFRVDKQIRRNYSRSKR